MKPFLCLVILLGLGTMAQAQNFEPTQKNIKKKKYRYCEASKAYINKETQEEKPMISYGTWTFNEQGCVVSYQKYNGEGNVNISGENTYNKKGKITLTEEDNKKIEEHERIVYNYDEKGRLTSKKDYRDKKLIVTYKHYYGDDMLRDSTIWLDKNDKPELIEYYKYNDQGWKIEQREKTDYGRADGKTIFEYHEDGTLKDEILYDGFGNIFERMFYNEAGLIIKREISYIDYQVVYEYFYNKKGIMESYTRAASNSPDYERIIFSWSKKIP